MISAETRRSFRELTRRRTRSVLTIATISVAVAGTWLFAIPGSVDNALTARVDHDRMHTVRLAPTAADLSADEVDALRSIANVESLDVRTLATSDILIGSRTQRVILVGVEDFTDQTVNVVSLDEGSYPAAPGQAVSDVDNLRIGLYRGGVGDTIQIRTALGRWDAFELVGRGGTIRYTTDPGRSTPVFYLPSDDVRRIMNYPAPNSIDVVAVDPSPAAVDAMVAELRAELAVAVPEIEYWDVIEVWRPGTWPGSDDFDNFRVVFYVIAAVALAAALILIFTTMNSVVREQVREIGVMKALGATPGAIRRSFLGTALVFGTIGTVIGIGLGIPLSNWLMTYMTGEFGGTDIGWQFSWIALALSLVVGLIGTVVAAWPAVGRAARLTVRDALDDRGFGKSFGAGRLDVLTARIGFVSRPSQMGVRNASRRVGRTVATAVPIGLAVGTMLGFGSVLITAVDADLTTFDLEGGDITIWNDGGRGLDAQVGELLEAIDGVALAHPMIYSSVELDGQKWVWGLTSDSTYDHDLTAGRWFTADEETSAAPVVVVGNALANQVGLDVGDVATIETRNGPVELTVIGIDRHLVNNGQGMYAPFQTVLDYEGWTSGQYWVRTVDRDPATVDAAADEIHRVLGGQGYDIGTDLRYIGRDQNEAENRLIVTVVMAMGLPVVAIGMIGLVSSMTSNIVDRTREIGVLRSIGARRRDLRAMFRAEAISIALLGWLAGIPIGYGLARLVLWVFEQKFSAPFVFRFPAWPPAVALVVTLVATLAVLRIPLRRALRMRPGDALRYE